MFAAGSVLVKSGLDSCKPLPNDVNSLVLELLVGHKS